MTYACALTWYYHFLTSQLFTQKHVYIRPSVTGMNPLLSNLSSDEFLVGRAMGIIPLCLQNIQSGTVPVVCSVHAIWMWAADIPDAACRIELDLAVSNAQP